MPSSLLAKQAAAQPYFDESRWPAVFIAGLTIVTMDTIDEYNAGIKRCLARREEFVVISDARAIREMGARERRATADFAERAPRSKGRALPSPGRRPPPVAEPQPTPKCARVGRWA